MIKIQLLSLAFLLQCQTSQCASSGTYHTHKEWRQYLTVPHPAQNRILASTNKAFFSDIVEFPPASSSFHETGPFAFLNAFLSKKRPNENGSSRIRNRKLTEENDKNPNPAQPATPPKEEGNGWWVRLDESSDTNYNLGIPSNRRSLSSTIYKFPMGGGVTPVIPQNDADAGDSADADTGTDTDTDTGDSAGDSNGTDADVSDSADAGIGTNVDAGDSVGADTDADTSESVDADTDTDTDADLDNQTSNILHVADSLDDNEVENTESGNEQAKDGDEEEVHGKRFLDNEETDSNHEQPLEYQEYMIISGGFTDDDWVTFPVWAYDLTASRTTGTGVWIPLHVVPADDDSKNGNESREKPKSRESDLEVGQNGDSNRNPGPSGRVGHISSMHNGYLYIFGGLTFQENQFSVDNDLIIWRAKIDHLLRDNEDENKEDSDNEPKQNPHPQLDWEIVTPHVVPDVDGATLRNLPRGEAQGTVYNSIEIDDEGNMKEKSYWIFHGGLTTKSSTAHHSHFTSIDVPLSDTWSYDFETNELKLLDTGCTVESYLECYAKPIARTAHAGAIMEDELVIYGGMTTLTDTDYFGGLGGGQKWDMLADVWSFNLITHQWKKWEIDPLLGRSYHSLVGWDGIVPDENDQKIPDKVEFEIGSGALGGEKVVFDGDEKDGRARGSVISYGGFRTYETVAGESIAFVFSDTLMAHPPSEVIPDDPFPQVSVSFWYKAQWPPGAPEAVSHRLEHTSVIDSAGNLIVWGGRFKDVNQLSGLWSLNLFGPQSKVQFKVAGPDGLDAYEAQLETLHLLVAVMLFMSVIFTALYGTLRRQAEEGGQGNRNGGRSNFLGRRRGVSQEIMDSIPVKTYVKPSRLEPTLGSEEVDACGQISSGETTNAYNEEEEECCAICLLEYQEGDKIRVFPCDHEFHKDCIDSWLENSSSCPTCRHSLYENPPSTASSSSDNNDEMRDADNSSTSDSASSSINFASLDLYRRGYVNNMGLGRRRRRNLFGTLWRNPTVHANVVDGFEAEEAQQYISTLELHEDSAIDDDIGPQTHPQNVENRSSLYPGRSRRMRNMGRNRIRRGSSGRAQTESVTLNLPLTNDSSIV